jgi:hypothetical protein
MCVRIHARCTTNRRCVGNISHFPESPFANYLAGGAMLGRLTIAFTGQRYRTEMENTVVAKL